MKATIVDALQALGYTDISVRGEPSTEEEYKKDVKFYDGEDENELGIEITQPVNWTTVKAKLDEIQPSFTAKQYQEDRIFGSNKSTTKYPPIDEQLDMLWHAIDQGALDKTSNFYTTIKAVKDAHPKP